MRKNNVPRCIICDDAFTEDNPSVLDGCCLDCCGTYAPNHASIKMPGVLPYGGFSGETLPKNATPEERRACFRIVK